MIREQMYAALGATNEAILRTTAQDDLFQRVCDAAVHEGGFMAAAAMLPETGDWLCMAAASGFDSGQSRPELRISVNAETERGQGLAGTAFRSGSIAFTNDYHHDSRLRPWWKDERFADVGAAAAIPILRNASSVGVFVFWLKTSGSLTPDVLGVLERMVENVSFALGMFEREQARRKTEEAHRRVSTMFAALSATNTAILRSRSRKEMFDRVCEAVANSGRSLRAAAILIENPLTNELAAVAVAGRGLEAIHSVSLSADPDRPRGQGLAGPAFREQKLKISYDLSRDERTKAYATEDQRAYGGAAVPLIVNSRSIGVLYFFFAPTSGSDDPEMVKLMEDIGENVSFGLAMFEREEHKESLSKMYAALSATNEAIMRAETREEMFDLVCQAAVNGAKFTFTAVGLARDHQDYFDVVAAAGPTAARGRTLKYSPRADLPEGRGITGTSYRTGKPAVSNDYQTDQRSAAFRGVSNASQSGASIPLMVSGAPIGFLLFMSAEKNTFTPGFVDLLQRLADNVSFALENFERRDDARKSEAKIQHLATHDPLTGLPNRTMFAHLLEHSIAAAQRGGTQCAVLFIDLDRFKIINDSLGHTAGDRLLIETAGRLKSSVRDSDVVARLGGDEFVIIVNQVHGRADVETVARKVLANLTPSLSIAGHDCRTTASIGIALYPEHGEDAHTLTKNADIAMYLAKEAGKNDFRFFSADIKTQSIERLMLETGLRQALEQGELELHYQPKISASSGEVIGVEALVRWRHPDHGLLSPGQFIPVAEETGLIIPIGRWVLRTACVQAARWREDGLPPISMAVNLSPRQFQDEHLLNDLDQILRDSGLNPSMLQLEITESMVMQNVERAIKTLDAIQSRGVRLAIDDFGTGYSSMSLMKQFPIDTIKIDRSFVRDLGVNMEDRAIATAIISLGRALGLTVVAEGVETRQQQAILTEELCDQLQGFLFSRPVPAKDIPQILSEPPQRLLTRYSRQQRSRRVVQ